MEKQLVLSSEAETLALGHSLAALLSPGDIVFLQGQLGAGKTTLVRGVLRGLGYSSLVKSPTYAIVESYSLGGLLIYHFDLYRISDPQELYDIGLADYLAVDAVLLIEWPEKASVLLPDPTLVCQFTTEASAKRSVTVIAKRGQILTSLHG